MGMQTSDYFLLLAVGATAGVFVNLIDKSLLRVQSNGKDKPRVLKIRRADQVTLLRVKSNSN